MIIVEKSNKRLVVAMLEGGRKAMLHSGRHSPGPSGLLNCVETLDSASNYYLVACGHLLEAVPTMPHAFYSLLTIF